MLSLLLLLLLLFVATAANVLLWLLLWVTVAAVIGDIAVAVVLPVAGADGDVPLPTHLGLRRQHEVVGEHGPRALPHDGDVPWVAPELLGVGASPLQRRDQVADAKVRREGVVL